MHDRLVVSNENDDEMMMGCVKGCIGLWEDILNGWTPAHIPRGLGHMQRGEAYIRLWLFCLHWLRPRAATIPGLHGQKMQPCGEQSNLKCMRMSYMSMIIDRPFYGDHKGVLCV